MGLDSDSSWVRLKGRRAASTNTKEYNHSPPTRTGAPTNAGFKVIHFREKVDESSGRLLKPEIVDFFRATEYKDPSDLLHARYLF